MKVERRFLVRDLPDALESRLKRHGARLLHAYVRDESRLVVYKFKAGSALHCTKSFVPCSDAMWQDHEKILHHDCALELLCKFMGGSVKPAGTLEIIRYAFEHGGHWFDLDCIQCADGPLYLARTLMHGDMGIPDWFGEEVTDDPQYCYESIARANHHGEMEEG